MTYNMLTGTINPTHSLTPPGKFLNLLKFALCFVCVQLKITECWLLTIIISEMLVYWYDCLSYSVMPHSAHNLLMTLCTTVTVFLKCSVINSCCFSVNLYVVGLEKQSEKLFWGSWKSSWKVQCRPYWGKLADIHYRELNGSGVIATYAMSASTLLVEWQEGYLACKNIL